VVRKHSTERMTRRHGAKEEGNVLSVLQKSLTFDRKRIGLRKGWKSAGGKGKERTTVRVILKEKPIVRSKVANGRRRDGGKGKKKRDSIFLQ